LLMKIPGLERGLAGGLLVGAYTRCFSMAALAALATLATTTASLLPLWTASATAGEADDLQVMIDRAKRAASDLQRLDEQNAVPSDLTVLRLCLEEAWRLRSDQKYDEVRDTLTRCDAQSEMIRQRLLAATLGSEAQVRENELKKLREQVDKTRKAIQAATLQKASLEGRSKK
jgi:hypothetical protein